MYTYIINYLPNKIKPSIQILGTQPTYPTPNKEIYNIHNIIYIIYTIYTINLPISYTQSEYTDITN